METWDILLSIGLRQDGESAGYSLDLGSFKLLAARGPNRWFVDVIHLGGVISYRSRGSLDGLTEIAGQIPATVGSREEALAYLASTLDRHSRNGRFVSAQPLPWLEEGRAHLHLVPWERALIEARERQARYHAAPKCQADRDWVRLVLRRLGRAAAGAEAGHVEIFFDGKCLWFEHGGERHPMAARGDQWPHRVKVSVRHFLQSVRLPPVVEVCVLDQVLLIGRHSYPLDQPDVDARSE